MCSGTRASRAISAARSKSGSGHVTALFQQAMPLAVVAVDELEVRVAQDAARALAAALDGVALFPSLVRGHREPVVRDLAVVAVLPRRNVVLDAAPRRPRVLDL